MLHNTRLAAIALVLGLGAASAAHAQNDTPRSEAIVPAIASQSDTVIGLFLAADTAVSDGRIAEASDLYARAAQLAEGEARTFLREQGFMAAVVAGRIEQAMSLAPTGEEGSLPVRRLASLVRAVDALKKGDSETADRLLSGDTIGQPYRNAAVLLRPWAAIARGQAPTPAPGVARNDVLGQAISQYNRALVLDRTGRIEEARAAYQEAMAGQVQLSDVVVDYGAFLERRGERNDAIAVYRRYLDQRPGAPRVVAALERAQRRRPPPPVPTIEGGAARILALAATGSYSQEQTDTAMAYLHLARHLDSSRDDVLLMLGELENMVGSPEAARRAFEQVSVQSPEYIEARIQLANNWRRAGDLDRAIAMARETARLAPRSLDAQVDLASQLLADDQHDEAVRVLNRAVRQAGRAAPWNLYFMRAVALDRAGDWGKAERDLQTALEIEPSQADVMNYLGYAWADRGVKLDQALEMLQAAVRAEPNNGHIIDSLGWVHFRLGHNDQAIEHLEKAVGLEAGNPEINDHLGDAYLRAGRRLEAVFQWERVLTLDPDPQMRAAVEAKLVAERPAASTIAASEPAAAVPGP